MNASPNERGTCLLITAITVCAHSTAASVASTRRAERYIAVRVGRRNLNHRDVARKHAAAVELLRLAQEDGNVVGVARLRHLTHVPADEKRVELENPFELGSGIGSRALGVQMVYVNVLQLAVAAPLAPWP